MTKLLFEFIGCHHGVINRMLHVVGFALIAYGIVEKNVWFVLVGAVFQEAGHFYQYAKTKRTADSPLYCLRSQAILVYPIFFLILAYTILG